jgi:hypothetical protein
MHVLSTQLFINTTVRSLEFIETRFDTNQVFLQASVLHKLKLFAEFVLQIDISNRTLDISVKMT